MENVVGSFFGIIFSTLYYTGVIFNAAVAQRRSVEHPQMRTSIVNRIIPSFAGIPLLHGKIWTLK